MIPRPGDDLLYDNTGTRFKVIRVEDATGQHAGKLKLFAHRFGEDGRLERDFEAWFIYPMSQVSLKVIPQYQEEQLDLFGE